MHGMNDIHISKVMHGGHEFTAKTAHQHGASSDGTKAHGGWSKSGSFWECYDRALPVDALLGADMFNGQKPETYFVAHTCACMLYSIYLCILLLIKFFTLIDPPQELLRVVFPWIEGKIEAL